MGDQSEQGLRVVFINHTHPDEKHVSALRMASFARAMAGAGHKVVLLCETLNADDAVVDMADLSAALASHDYTSPYVLACRPSATPLLARARTGNLPWGLRHAVLGASYLWGGGVFTDWRNGAKPYIGALAEHFRPDIVWATFGNTDAWNIAQKLSRAADCPWVADIKDPWGRFLPYGLAHLIAGRYRDAVHMTTFSDAHSSEAGGFFDLPKTIIYSGFDTVDRLPDPSQPFRVLLTGSVYNDDSLAKLLDGLALWLQDRPAADVVFTYAGNDTARLKRHCSRLDGLCKIDIRPFMPVAELRQLQLGAHINAYIHNPDSLFHHKVLELLAAGRPVVCVPGESDEAKAIADQVGAHMLVGNTAADIARALDAGTVDNISAPDPDKLNAYCWSAQADKLVALFRSIIGEKS